MSYGYLHPPATSTAGRHALLHCPPAFPFTTRSHHFGGNGTQPPNGQLQGLHLLSQSLRDCVTCSLNFILDPLPQQQIVTIQLDLLSILPK